MWSRSLLACSLLTSVACQPGDAGRALQVLPAFDGELDDASLLVDGWFTTIQAAVDAANNGDTVSIPSGTYYEDVVVAANITLQGAGPGETIIVGTVSTGEGYAGLYIRSMSIYSETWVSKGIAGVDAYGLHTLSSSAIEISDMDIQGFQRGVYIDYGNCVYIFDSSLSNNDYGVYAVGAFQPRVYNSLITSNSMAGDGISWEKVDYAAGDVTGNWVRTTDACNSTSSPGRLNAAAGGLCGALILTEVMANPDDEDTGEFIEIHNAGDDTVDLVGLILSDGDTTDTLEAYDGGVTELPPGGYALILDVEYAGEYSIDGDAVLVTTDDTTVGNALATSDEVTLYEADGVHPIDAFLHPTNPGNAVSVERVSLTGIDDDSNWTACTCPGGSSPGLANCASEAADTVSDLYGYLIVTEIMSNPTTESTGEFIELYNDGSTDIDLAGFVLYDGDAADTIEGFTDPTDTVLPPMGFAVILDSGYAGEYSIVAGTLLLTTDDAALASGLAVNDPVYLFEPNGISLVDGYSWPLDAGDGVSVEKVDLLMGDRETNWDASACAAGSSPGDGPCFP